MAQGNDPWGWGDLGRGVSAMITALSEKRRRDQERLLQQLYTNPEAVLNDPKSAKKLEKMGAVTSQGYGPLAAPAPSTGGDIDMLKLLLGGRSPNQQINVGTKQYTIPGKTMDNSQIDTLRALLEGGSKERIAQIGAVPSTLKAAGEISPNATLTDLIELSRGGSAQGEYGGMTQAQNADSKALLDNMMKIFAEDKRLKGETARDIGIAAGKGMLPPSEEAEAQRAHEKSLAGEEGLIKQKVAQIAAAATEAAARVSAAKTPEEMARIKAQTSNEETQSMMSMFSLIEAFLKTQKGYSRFGKIKEFFAGMPELTQEQRNEYLELFIKYMSKGGYPIRAGTGDDTSDPPEFNGVTAGAPR